MINIRVAKKAIGIMSLLKFFPGSEDSQAALIELLGSMCQTDEEVIWLARRTADICEEWPGVQVLWQIRFSKFPPRNDREKRIDLECGSSKAFPEGVPRERTEKEIKELTEGRRLAQIKAWEGLPKYEPKPGDEYVPKVIADTIKEVAAARAMPPVKRFRTISDDEARVDATLRNMYGEGDGR